MKTNAFIIGSSTGHPRRLVLLVKVFPRRASVCRASCRHWPPPTSSTGLLTNGNQVTITDTNPIPPQEFYRIGISLP